MSKHKFTFGYLVLFLPNNNSSNYGHFSNHNKTKVHLGRFAFKSICGKERKKYNNDESVIYDLGKKYQYYDGRENFANSTPKNVVAHPNCTLSNPIRRKK